MMLPPFAYFPPANGDAYQCRFEPERSWWRLQVPNGELLYSAQFLSAEVADAALAFLIESNASAPDNTPSWANIAWRRDEIRLFGKKVPIPRLSAWYGDAGKTYRYSGLTLAPNPWNPALLELKTRVEQAAEEGFNSVLLNWYRDGQDSMGWHSDDEPELGQNPTIASLNLGATRRFLLRRIGHPTEKIELPLGHGALLLMRGELQHHWQHAVPKQKNAQPNRVNLTFRVIR